MSIIEKALKKRQEAAQGLGDATPRDTTGNGKDLVERAVAGQAESGVAAGEQPRMTGPGNAPDDPAVAAQDDPRRGGDIQRVDRARLKRKGILRPEDERSHAAEEFRLVKRPILSNAFGPRSVEHGNLVMVTSALPGEGKTYCSLNLAISIAAEMNRTVLLVDADVARPGVPGFLGIEPGIGLMDLLVDGGDVADALVKTDIPKLTVLPAGRRHRYSTELLASQTMADLLTELGARYPDRLLLFDSPPLLATSEAGVLAAHMGQIVLVVEADRTPQAALERATEHLSGHETVMTLLNKTGKVPGRRYDYGYYGDYNDYTNRGRESG